MVIAGRPAQLLYEVWAMGLPVCWKEVAKEIWRHNPSEKRLQYSFFRAKQRLHEKLMEAGIRHDIVHSDGNGNIEMHLLPWDEVINESGEPQE